MNRLTTILVSLLFIASGLHAQVFPVRTITNVTPPYPVSLEQYAGAGDEKISLTIIPVSVALENTPVKLKLFIAGNGFRIYTDPNFVHRDILLNNGETQTFTGTELAPWFNIDNLIFEGLSKNQYLKTGRLPEGMTQVWFETWDYNRNYNISGTYKATIWMFENDPPVLNFPEQAKELPGIDPQNIVFNWSLRQAPFSSSGSGNQFKFELWEVEQENMNAEEVVRTTRPLYTGEINTTVMNYTTGEPVLLLGRKYVWRVQVFDPEGRNRFKNDGYSEVRWFRFGKLCGVPVPLLDKTTTSSVSIKWEGDYTFEKYELRWRNKNNPNANWYSKDVTGQNYTIENLEQNTPYEVQLRGFCGTQEGEYSLSLSARTKQDVAFQCGAAPGNADTATSTPLAILRPGEYFRASDFDIQVYKVSGGNGNFSGKGFALVPLLKFIKFEVEFNGIQINSDHRMTAGEVNFVYNANNGMTLDVKKLFGDNTNDVVLEDNPYTDIADKITKVDSTISKITVAANGDVTIYTSDGHKQVVRAETGDMVAVEGKTEGSEQYVVDTQTGTVYSGQPEKGSSSNGSSSQQQPTPANKPVKNTVVFLPHATETYGMDMPDDKAPADNYDKATIGGAETLIPWKSVETNRMDRMIAAVTGNGSDSVKFMTESGNLVMTAPGDKSSVSSKAQGVNSSSVQAFKQVLVTGAEDNDKLKAWYAEKTSDSTENRILAGQINIAAYDKIIYDLCIVEVNGAAVPDVLPVEEELNKIYASSVIQWKVTKLKNFTATLRNMVNGEFDNTNTSDKMEYNDHEKQLISALKDHKEYKRKTFYLFFIGAAKDKQLKGYMPFNRNFGFIFRDNQGIDKLIRTMAHELGHGAFRLRHIFSPENQYIQTEGSTKNLMDYAGGDATRLHKYQWDEERKYHLGVNWFEEGEEAEVKTAKKVDINTFVYPARLITQYIADNIHANRFFTDAIKELNKINPSASMDFPFLFSYINNVRRIDLYASYEYITKLLGTAVASELPEQIIVDNLTVNNNNVELTVLQSLTFQKVTNEAILKDQSKFYGIQIPEGNNKPTFYTCSLEIEPKNEYSFIEIKRNDQNILKLNILSKDRIGLMVNVLKDSKTKKRLTRIFTTINKLNSIDKDVTMDLTKVNISIFDQNNKAIYNGVITPSELTPDTKTNFGELSNSCKYHLDISLDELKIQDYDPITVIASFLPIESNDCDKIYCNSVEYICSNDEWFDPQYQNILSQCDYNSYTAFKPQYEQIINTLNVDVDNPLEYLKSNIGTYTFLGKSFQMHKYFYYYVLKPVEERLKNKTEIVEHYKNKPAALYSFSMRVTNDPSANGQMSPHGWGIAIDVFPKGNPQLLKSALYAFYIKLVTDGFDVGEKKCENDGEDGNKNWRVGIQKVKDAHSKFLTRVVNDPEYIRTNVIAENYVKEQHSKDFTLSKNLNEKPNDLLCARYIFLNDYNENKDYLKVEKASLKEVLTKYIKDIEPPLIKEEIVKADATNVATNTKLNSSDVIFVLSDEDKDRIEKLKKLISALDMYRYTVVFKNSSLDGIEALKTLSQKLISSISTHDKTYLSIPLTIDDFLDEVTEFKDAIKARGYLNYKSFGQALSLNIKGIGFENILMGEGFYEFNNELITTFMEYNSVLKSNSDNKTIRLYNGAIYDHKLDGMHIEYNSYDRNHEVLRLLFSLPDPDPNCGK